MADEDLGSLAVKIAMEDSSFQQGMQDFKRQMNVLDSSFKSSIAGIKDWGKNLDSLKTNVQSLGDKINIQKQVVQEYQEQLEKSKTSLQENSAKMMDLKSKVESAKTAWEESKSAIGDNDEATKKLKQDYEELTKQYSTSENAVLKNNKSIEGYTIQLNNASGKLKTFESDLEKTNKQIDGFGWNKLSEGFKSVGDKFKSIGEGFKSVGQSITTHLSVPIAAAGVASVKFASDFEDGLAKISTIADTSQVSIKGIGEGVIKLSDDTGKSVEDLNEGLYQAISSGVQTGDTLQFMDTAAKAAIGGFTDTTTSVDGLTTVLNSYGLKASEADKIANQMIVTQNLGKTTFGELAAEMGNVTPTAAAANVSTKALFSSLAVLTANGMKTQVAVTSVKSALSNIIKPTDEAAKEAQRLGIEFNTAHLKAVGWQQFLEEIKEKTGGSTDSMAKLFGSVDALNGVLTLTSGQGMSLYNESIKEMNSSTNYVDDAFNKVNNTGAKNFQKSLNELKNASIQLGEALTPVVSELGNLIKGLAEWLNQLTPSQRQFVVTMGLMVAAIGPILLGIGNLIISIGAISTAFGTISGAIATAGGAMAVLTGPIGITIAIIAGLVAGGVFLYKNWDTIKAKAAELKESISTHFNAIKTDIANVWTSITTSISNAWTNIKTGVTNGATAAKNSILNVFNSISASLSNIWSNITNGAISGWNGLKSGISTVLNNIKSSVVIAWNTIKDSIIAVVTPIITSVITVFEKMKPGIQTVFTGLSNIIKGIWEGIKTIILGPVLLILDLVTGNFNKLSSDAQGIFNNLKSAFSSIWQGIQQVFTGYLQALSAFCSTIWTSIVNTATSLWNSFSSYMSSLWQEIVSVATNAWNSFSSFVTSLWSSIVSTAQSIWNAIPGFFSNLWNSIVSTATNAWNTLSSTVVDFCNSIVQGAENIWNSLLAWFEALPSRLYNAGVQMFESMKNGVSSALSTLYNTVVSGFNSAISYITSLPSQAYQWGVDFIDGLVNGIQGTIGSVENAVSALAAKIRSYLHFSVPDIGPLSDADTYGSDFMQLLADTMNQSSYKPEAAAKKVADLIAQKIQEVKAKVASETKDLNNQLSALGQQEDVSLRGTKGSSKYAIEDEYTAKKKTIKDEIDLRKDQADKEIVEIQKIGKMSKEQIAEELDAKKKAVTDIDKLNDVLEKAIERQLNSEKDAATESAKVKAKEQKLTKDQLSSLLQYVNDYYDKKLDKDAIAAQAEQLIASKNQDAIIALLKKYGNLYQDSGLTLGQRLTTGIKSFSDLIPNIVWEAMNSVQTEVQTAATNVQSTLNSIMQGISAVGTAGTQLAGTSGSTDIFTQWQNSGVGSTEDEDPTQKITDKYKKFFDDIDLAMTNLGRDTYSTTEELKKQQDTIDLQNKKLSEMKQEYNEVVAAVGSTDDSAVQLEKDIASLNIEIENSTKKMQQDAITNKYQKSFDETDDAVEKLSESTGNFSEQLENQKQIYMQNYMKLLNMKQEYKELADLLGKDSDAAVQCGKDIKDLQNQLDGSSSKIKDDTITGINELTSKIKEALKARYEEEENLEEEKANERLQLLSDDHEQAIKNITDEYDAKIKALDAQTQAEDRSTTDATELSNISNLQNSVDYEHNAYNKEQLQKQLSKATTDRTKRLHEQEIADQKVTLEQEKQNEIDHNNKLYEIDKLKLEQDLSDIKDFYKKKLDSANLEAEAEILVQTNNQNEIIKLLESYSSDYETAGKTLGQKLYDGFAEKIKGITDMISNITSQINAAKDSAVQAAKDTLVQTGTETYTAPILSSTDTARQMAVQTVTESVTNNFTYNSPVALTPSEQNRQVTNMMTKAAFSIG